jgi:threonine dehydratase
VNTIFVPIGGGSGACGNCLVRTALGSTARVVGVQAENADAFTRSFRTGTRVVGDSAATFAEGMATRVTFDLTFSFLAGELNDIVTLSERELAEGVRLALRGTHNLAEGAGASAIAAATKRKDTLNGQTVVAVMSGGNLDAAKLRWILNEQ